MPLFPDIRGRVRIYSALEGNKLIGICLIVKIIVRMARVIFVKVV